MRKINDRNEVYRNTLKVAKRIAITILCCIPILIFFGYFTRNIITNRVLRIVCFMIIMGVVVAVEEVIVRAKEKQKQEVETKDVFK